MQTILSSRRPTGVRQPWPRSSSKAAYRMHLASESSGIHQLMLAGQSSQSRRLAGRLGQQASKKERCHPIGNSGGGCSSLASSGRRLQLGRVQIEPVGHFDMKERMATHQRFKPIARALAHRLLLARSGGGRAVPFAAWRAARCACLPPPDMTRLVRPPPLLLLSASRPSVGRTASSNRYARDCPSDC